MKVTYMWSIHAGMYEWMNEISQFGDMLWSGSES